MTGILPAMLAVSILSGTMGIGVAIAAIPVLSLHGGDLVHVVQPVALALNGVTAISAAVSFGRAGYIEWRKGTALGVTMTVFAPIGAFAAQWISPDLLWILYFGAVALVVYLLGAPRPEGATRASIRTVVAWSAPVAAFSSMLGIGPGFLMVPLLILAGASPRAAAGTSAFAAVPASFAALVPHLGTATPDFSFAVPVVGVSAVGAWIGAYFASRAIPERFLRTIFVALILALASYKAAGLAWAKVSAPPAALDCRAESGLSGDPDTPACKNVR